MAFQNTAPLSSFLISFSMHRCIHEYPLRASSSHIARCASPYRLYIAMPRARRTSSIALSHPLTINGRPGFRRQVFGREEGGFRGGWMRRKQHRVLAFFSLLEVVKGQREGEREKQGGGGYLRPQPPALWILAARPVAQRQCMFCGERGR